MKNHEIRKTIKSKQGTEGTKGTLYPVERVPGDTYQNIIGCFISWETLPPNNYPYTRVLYSIKTGYKGYKLFRMMFFNLKCLLQLF